MCGTCISPTKTISSSVCRAVRLPSLIGHRIMAVRLETCPVLVNGQGCCRVGNKSIQRVSKHGDRKGSSDCRWQGKLNLLPGCLVSLGPERLEGFFSQVFTRKGHRLYVSCAIHWRHGSYDGCPQGGCCPP